MTTRAWLLAEQPASRRQARYGQAYRTWLALRSNRLAMLGLGIIALLVLMALFADIIAPYDPVVGGDLRTVRLLPPSRAHLMGTDDQARDIFSRVVHGARLTLMVVALVAIIATPIGLAVGTTAGYFGGWADIAMMLITEPELLIADEPTSALDVTVQIEVLRILDRLVADRGMGLIFISHDLRLVSSFCDRVLVMYAGRIVEEVRASELHHARHPYTRGLFNCLPRIEGSQRPLPVLERDAAWAN